MLVNWVLQAWDEVPLDLLQRGMEALILVSPLPSPLVAPRAPETVEAVAPDAALAMLGGDDAAPNLDLPDEAGDSSDGASDASEADEPVAPPAIAGPPDGTFCMRCERPVRAKNGSKCPNPRCVAWYHVGCADPQGAGKCMICK